MIINDTFTRTASSTWSSPDVGGPWLTSGGLVTAYSVTGTKGRVGVTGISTRHFTYSTDTFVDLDYYATIAVPVAATGGSISGGLVARRIDDNNFYMLQLLFDTAGTIDVEIDKRVAGTFTTLATQTNYIAYSAGVAVHARFRIIGITLQAKVWAGTLADEPDPWLLTVADNTFASGPIGTHSNLLSGNTNTQPVSVDYDDISASSILGGFAFADIVPARSDPYVLLVTDKNLNVIGDPLSDWTSLDITLRWNEPDSIALQTPAYQDLLDLFISGHRLVVVRNGSILTSGPFEEPQSPFQWAVGEEDAEPGTVTVLGSDDSVYTAGRVVYPDPAKTAADTTQPTDYTIAAAANIEDAMRSLVNLNVGPGALVARRHPNLVLGADKGYTETMPAAKLIHWEPLGDVLRTLAAINGFGYRVYQDGTQLKFEVFKPADRTKTARFSRGLGNLRGISYKLAAPTTNVAIVGSGGDDTKRTVREVINSSSVTNWWRIEQWADAQSDAIVNPAAPTAAELATLDQSGQDALLAGAENVELQAITIDTDDMRFGVNYNLGDKVTIEVFPGFEVADTVRSVHITVDPDGGEFVQSTVGSQEATTDPGWVRVVKDLNRRIGRLEVYRRP